MSVDKNIAVVLRENISVVKVVFPVQGTYSRPSDGKHYSYASRFTDHKVGDKVVVSAPECMKVVEIVAVDNEANIPASCSDKKMGWVVSKIDVAGWEADNERNLAIEASVGAMYKKNAKKQLQAQLLGALDDDSRQSLLALCAG